MEQLQLDGFDKYDTLNTEGALVTVWRNPTTGYHEALIATWSESGEPHTTRWEDAGPFDVTEALKAHADCLRRLHLL